MFLQASVSHSVQRGGSGHPWSQVPSRKWPGPFQEGMSRGVGGYVQRSGWVCPGEGVGMSRGGVGMSN